MKKIGLSYLIAGLLLATVAGAEPVAVEDGAVFIADNDELSVKCQCAITRRVPGVYISSKRH